MDCEKFSLEAQQIFQKIITHYSVNPWGTPQWTEDGSVFDNGWHDLKRKDHRDKLLKWYECLVGTTVVSFARRAEKEGRNFSDEFINLKMLQVWIDLALLIEELDFQIETLDLCGE